MQIHLGMDIRQTNCPGRHKEHLGGFKGSNILKAGEAVKQLDRLAPALVHVGGFIWEWAYQYKSPLNTPGGMAGELGGHIFKSFGKLSNGWTDWHQIWYTSVDSSGNGHSLKTIRPTIPQGGILGGLLDQQFKILGNVVKRLDRLGINCAKCR